MQKDDKKIGRREALALLGASAALTIGCGSPVSPTEAAAATTATGGTGSACAVSRTKPWGRSHH